MILDDQDLANSGRNGMRVKGLKPEPPKKREPDPMAPIIDVLKQMSSAIETALARKQEAPKINVEAPNVSVNVPDSGDKSPTTAAPQPILKWEGEITQRDNNGRMKKFVIKALT
jgi:hypothetical protein